MKKVLIGVGIGCGVIVLIGVGALFAAGLWAKNTFGGSLEAMQKIQAQEQELAQLNQSHPFQAPARGEVLALDAKRLDTYLAVREEAVPVFKAYEEKTKEFEQKHGGKDGDKADFSAAVDAANLSMGLVADVRATYIGSLKKHGMSPAEFQAITSAVYVSVAAEGLGKTKEAMAQGREALEKQLADFDQKLAGDSLSEEERQGLEEARAQLQATVDSLDSQGDTPDSLSEDAKKVAAANLELLKKYEDRVQVMSNAAFDGFVLGDAGGDMAGGATARDLD
jgi:hypothetical protein